MKGSGLRSVSSPGIAGGRTASLPLAYDPTIPVFQKEALARPVAASYFIFMVFTRITIDPAVCTGKPCIRGLRFPIARLLGLMATGETRDAILQTYPYLESDDIDEALRYAAFLAEDETIELSPPVSAK
jgi:uncharacterized protein (DUF433 family)